jgi:hypothetical protein
MAIVHRATLTPSKLELLEKWLPGQPWFRGSTADLVRAGSFRCDDPDGEVGVETLLVASGSSVFHVPLTYRGAPLEGAEACLVGIMEHSVLGTRWIYDAAGDPVYAAALAAMILTGQPQAVQSIEVNGKLEHLPESVHLHSTGKPDTGVPAIGSAHPANVGDVTLIQTGGLELSVSRVLHPLEGTPDHAVLSATWEGQPAPVQLAAVTVP